MKNLKITLLYKIIIIFLLIVLGITYFKVNNYKVLDKNVNEITGVIKNIKYNNGKLEIEIENSNILIIQYIDTYPNIYLGDLIKVKGNLEVPSQNTIFNLFNYQKYLLSKKIHYVMNALEINKIKDNSKLKYKIKNMIITHISEYKTGDYLNTFILGSNTIDDNIKSSIQINGISHLFAVSGMHLSLFSSIILICLRKLKVSDNISYIFIILFFIFFSFLTNYSPSVLRSLFMYIGLSINKIFNLKMKSIYICLLSLSILLMINPFYIYNIGFIFSYTVSITLIIFSSKFNVKGYFKTLFLTSTLAFISSMPILFQNYFSVNILTPFVNLIFVPLVSFIVFPLALLTFIFKPLDKIFYFSTYLLEKLSLFLEQFNISLTLAQVPWYILIIYYLFIILFFYGLINKNYKKLIPLIILVCIHTNIRYFNCSFKITILDVSQGDSIFVALPHNTANILIDTGGKYNSDIVKSKTIPYLKSQGVNKIDYLFISHGDYDHMGDAINLVNNFKVKNVIFNNDSFNELETELIKVLEDKNIKYYKGLKELNIGNDKLYFLNTKEYDNENDNSNVLYFKLNDYKFLFMGDAGIEREKDILNKYNLSNIDFIKIGHHGSNTSSSKEFINSIKPKNCLISVGAKNRYGHPKQTVLDTLDDYCDIYRTDLNGSIEIKINKNNYKIKTYSP